MNCPVCGNANPHEARFCVTCGVPLGSQGDMGPSDGVRRRGLTPMDIGGLLEETVSIYRRNYGPFILISLVGQIPAILLSLFSGGDAPAVDSDPIGVDLARIIPLLGFVALTLFVILYTHYMASAASVMAVSQYYTAGRIDVGYCFKRAWYKIASLSAAYVVFGLSLIGAGVLSLFIVGIPLFFYLLVVWFFFIECIMLERKSPLDSLWRSRELVQGNFWRVFLIGIAYTVIALAFGLIVGMADFALSAISPILGVVAAAAIGVLIAPVSLIGRTLVYYDLRARKEGYTMDDLAADAALPEYREG